MVLTLFIMVALGRGTKCKRLMMGIFIVFHSYWMTADLLCSTEVLHSIIALFTGMYATALVYLGVFDNILDKFRCLCCRIKDDMEDVKEYIKQGVYGEADDDFQDF
jgi:hypothetical protein